MDRIKRLKDAAGRWAFAKVPGLRENWETRFEAVCSATTPWAPMRKPLRECRVALVTTAGVHHASDRPFDMSRDVGDASYRVIETGGGNLTITHDYYDHRDADRDVNIVLPIDRMREAARLGVIGALHIHAWSFMGHVQGPQLATLIDRTAPEVAAAAVAEGVEVAFLTPA
ncbi:MAG: hypothetical protein IT350_18585 [Deltaproteobacteria bacterium]|nr:hypothetical protein [Deltaproteobacteria bacterium]